MASEAQKNQLYTELMHRFTSTSTWREFLELAKQFRVMSIPTLMIFEGGEMVRKTMGAMDKVELLDFIYE